MTTLDTIERAADLSALLALSQEEAARLGTFLAGAVADAAGAFVVELRVDRAYRAARSAGLRHKAALGEVARVCAVSAGTAERIVARTWSGQPESRV